MFDYNLRLKSYALGRSASYLAFLLCSVAQGPAFAQDVSEQDAGGQEASEQDSSATIVVTGSRIVRNGYDAPTPQTVVGQDLLEAKPTTQISDVLATIPAFRDVATTNGVGLSNSGAGGASFANLRGLGSNRTLVLMDGQRFVPSTETGAIDIGLIPTALISRIDIVTGGASAAYGSDAVAGVVNFVLDNRLEGGRVNAEATISQYGDNFGYKVSGAYGTQLGDRAHLVVAGSYTNTDGLQARERDYLMSQTSLLTNSGFTPNNGQFRRYILPNAYNYNSTIGGIIRGGPLDGITFGENGAIGTYPAGGLYPGRFTALPAETDRTDLMWSNIDAWLIVPLENTSGYARLSYDAADNAEIFASFTYGNNRPGPYISTPANTEITGFYPIKRDNAFLPDEIAQLMDANGLSSINLGKISEDWGPAILQRENTTYRGVVGLKADIATGWELESYIEYGENHNAFSIERNVYRFRQAAAVDAVRNNGSIVCRVNVDANLTNDMPGCVPLNPFGLNQASPEALDYIFGTSSADLTYKQEVYSVAISGEPFDLWAGPVSLAFGGEHRRESMAQTVDEVSLANPRNWHFGSRQPTNASMAVTEGFVETIVPIFEGFDFNGAFRYTDYNTTGSVNTWKVGATWEATDSLRFRATKSRDIRAPNLNELAASGVQQSVQIEDPFHPQLQPYFAQRYQVGNPNLEPEKADTFTGGMVFQPVFAPGLSLSVDYYDIEINGAIQTIGDQDLIDRCFNGNESLCDLITFKADGTIASFISSYVNLASIATSGVDFEMSYRAPVGPGDLSSRLLVNRLIKFDVDDGITVIDRAGDINDAQPKLTASFNSSYTLDAYRLDFGLDYIGSGNFDNDYLGDPTAINDNSISARLYANARFAYKFEAWGEDQEVYFHVANITNVRPAAIYEYSGGANYDRSGRTFRLGARVSF